MKNYDRYHPTDPYDSPPRYYGQWKPGRNSWHLGSLLAGGYKEIQISGPDGKLFLVPKILAGVALAKRDSIAAFSKSDTVYAEFGVSKQKAMSPSFLLGTSLGCRLSAHFDVLIDIAYFQTAKMSFGETTSRIAATTNL